MRLILITLTILFFVNLKTHALESKTSVIINSLCDSLINSLSDTKIQRLAVLPLSDKEQPERGLAISELIIVKFNRLKNFTIVDRTDFQKMLQESDFSESDLADQSTAVKAGKFLAADAVVTGNIGDIFGQKSISVKIIRTETLEILSTASVMVTVSSLNTFPRELFGEQLQTSSAIFRSLVVPGWGQFYTARPGQGFLFSFSAMLSTGGLIWSAIDLNQKSSSVENNKLKYLSHDPQEDLKLKHAAITKRDEAIQRTAIAGTITGLIWVANVIDAAVLGKKQKKSINNLYFSSASNSNGVAVVISF